MVSRDVAAGTPAANSRRTVETVDLMEYQAKELFAKHGVPVTVGTVVTRS